GYREADNGPVAAEPAVGEQPAQERQQVAAHLEGGVDWRRLRVAEMQGRRHVQEQDCPHAVVGAAFGEFSPEEEIESFRMRLRDMCIRGLNIYRFIVSAHISPLLAFFWFPNSVWEPPARNSVSCAYQETEFPAVRSQTEFGNEVERGRRGRFRYP